MPDWGKGLGRNEPHLTEDLIRWDVEKREASNSVQAHGERFYGLALSADGKRVVTAGWDYEIKIWDSTLTRAMPDEPVK